MRAGEVDGIPYKPQRPRRKSSRSRRKARTDRPRAGRRNATTTARTTYAYVGSESSRGIGICADRPLGTSFRSIRSQSRGFPLYCGWRQRRRRGGGSLRHVGPRLHHIRGPGSAGAGVAPGSANRGLRRGLRASCPRPRCPPALRAMTGGRRAGAAEPLDAANKKGPVSRAFL